PKEVWTSNEEGAPIKVVKSLSDSEEGRMVANTIFGAKVNDSLKNQDFAILYRTNAQSRSMEEALRKMNIKYRIIGGLSFYQRKEIKDLIAYLRFTVNHQDEEALKRSINLPKRGIGNTTLAKLIALSEQERVPIWEILKKINQYMKGRVVTAIGGFVTLIQSFATLTQQHDAYVVASQVAKNSGLLRELYEDKTIEGLSRYENVQELLNAIKEFVDNPEQEDHSLTAFLQEVSLLTSIDEAGDDDDDKVTLMTIHGAKGLEFNYVFVVGMEEELFPSQMMLNSRADLEEERRLFYVALTRAQKRLYLSYAVTRYQFGRLKNCEPSRFLLEIDEKYVDHQNQKGNSLETDNRASFVHQLKPRFTRVAKNPNKIHQPSPDFSPSDTKNLKTGMKVEHLKFGFGIVKEVQEYNEDRKACINFEDYGEKTLLLSFAKLKIHSE
ncbi:MAG: 3'-5' exonuclease, partial [Bacteroidota bacterium]